MNIKDVIKLVKIMELVPDFAKNVFDKLEKKAELIEYLNNSKGKFQILGSIVLAKDINKDDPLDNFLDKIFKDGNKKDKFEEQAVNLFGFFNTLKGIFNQQDNKISFYLNELIKSYNKIKKDDLKLDKGNLNLIEDQQSHKNLETFIETYNNEIEKIKSAKIVDSKGEEITEKKIKELFKNQGLQMPETNAKKSINELPQGLDKFLKITLDINNELEENYKLTQKNEELIELVKTLIKTITNEEEKEEEKIKSAKALFNIDLTTNINKLYRALFLNLEEYLNEEKIENNKCVLSNEIAKIRHFNKFIEEMNKSNNNELKEIANKLNNNYSIKEKYGKIQELIDTYKNMITKKIDDEYIFLKLDEKISTDDSKIKKLLDSIKDENNYLSKLINKIIIFSEEIIGITNLLKDIVLPSELII